MLITHVKIIVDPEDNEEDTLTVITTMLLDGISLVREAGGDSRLKLEKFLVNVVSLRCISFNFPREITPS